VKEISAFIKTYGKENGYGMIMDSSGLTRNFIPVIVYYPEERDITDKVMAELNRGHEDDVPKPRDAAAAGAKDAAPTAAGDEGQAE